MSDRLACQEVEELFSEYLSETLDPSRSAEVMSHLEACASCSALRSAMAEVLEALHAYPALDPPSGLVERVAAAALSKGKTARKPFWPVIQMPEIGLPAGLQVLAAGIALLLTGVTVLAATQSSRIKERTLNAGAFLSERKERVVEDIRLLRVVVTTAFEGRLDRVNDRVNDYRRLLEKRRAVVEQEQKRSGQPESDAGSVRSAAQRADLPPVHRISNNAGRRVVTASEHAGARRRRCSRRES